MNDSEYLIKLGEKIRSIRKKKNITQIELAEKIGTKHTQIGRIELGKANSTINMLRKIAHELEIPLIDLIVND